MITKNYRLYGPTDALPDVRYRVTCYFNFVPAKRKKLLWIIRNADDYTVAVITAENAEECRSFLDEQISDGFFGQYSIEHIEEL